MEFFRVACDHCSSELLLKVRSRLGTEVPCPRCGERFIAREVINDFSDPEDTDSTCDREADDSSSESESSVSAYDDEAYANLGTSDEAAYSQAYDEILNAAGRTNTPVESELLAEPDESADFEKEDLVASEPVPEPQLTIESFDAVQETDESEANSESAGDEPDSNVLQQVAPVPSGRLAACRRAVARASVVVWGYCQTRQFRAGALSLTLHAILLALLALIVLPNAIHDLADYVIVSSIDDSTTEDSLLSAKQEAVAMEVGKVEPSLIPATMVGAVTEAPLDPLEAIEVPEMPQSSSNKGPSAPTTKKTAEKRPRPVTRLMPAISKRGTAVKGPLLTQPEKGVKQADTAQAAAKGLFDHLRGATGEKGPVWIVWVMDASLSLVAEREELAPQVQAFYEDLVASNGGEQKLVNTAVLAFGNTVQPVASNSRNADGIARAIKNLPIDMTGTENVMSAVTYAINSLTRFKGRIEVVVWTDESGDDLNFLEDVISLCRQKKARVHVIGPLSVFGMEPGLQRFVMPKPHEYRVLLPVKRGPDSSFPERARLPLWYGSTDRPWSDSSKLMSDDGEFANLGGPLRQRLLAGTGPYGLTRLALATGGTFTALKRDGDLAPPDRERFVQYLPDYRSAMEIASDIELHPLRKAIIEAAALTWQINYWPPRRSFPIANDTEFPYRSYSYYVTPVNFQTMLERELRLDHEKLTVSQVVLEQAIDIMLAAESTRTDRMGEEESLRWKAWYDLNLGRLLAHSVRIREYLNLAERMILPDFRAELFKRGINHLQISESVELSTGRVGVQRAQQAKALLERVIKEHPDTPWSQLAKWELEHELGFNFQTLIIPPPKPVPFVPRGPSMPAPQIPRL